MIVTAALSVLLGSNWPAEPVSLWVETQTLICDQFLAALGISAAVSANIPEFLLFVCMYTCTRTSADCIDECRLLVCHKAKPAASYLSYHYSRAQEA